MKQAELQHYRAMLQAQAVEPGPRRGMFRLGERRSTSAPAPQSMGDGPVAPPIRRDGALFGRRRALEPVEAGVLQEAPLLLDAPLAPALEAPSKLGRLRAPLAAAHFSETPYHAEDLADPPTRPGVTPGVIAGWSAAKPEGAERRLLRRLTAVLDAEGQGLAARLASAGVA